MSRQAVACALTLAVLALAGCRTARPDSCNPCTEDGRPCVLEQGECRPVDPNDPKGETMKKVDPGAVRQTVEMLTVLASESRLSIVAHLAQREEMSVGQITEAVGVTLGRAADGQRLSGISQHLAKMKAWGFVIPRREAQTIFYRLSPDHPVTTAVLGLLEGA
jgi:DNA-binding transcriptional ArsR family regulator